jgi:Lhr-like helicase
LSATQRPLEEIARFLVAKTDKLGFYRIPGLFEGVEEVSADKEGYESTKSSVSITGDTRFDIQIVRR